MRRKPTFILKPSSIEGIGVFALSHIPQGALLNLFDSTDYRLISRHKAGSFPKSVLETFCVEDSAGYHCPADFHRMSVGWYLNHSEQPNAGGTRENYYALRDISEGEEITIDYATLSAVEAEKLSTEASKARWPEYSPG
jgi:SET domain-containing protein